ncbi:MAG: restriction endonuclease [Gammaproteobacteria bacterium]|nr:restriction endonuclease [Gammaproteobacteria bacterium]
MTKKNKSFFKTILNTVSKLSWLKGAHEPAHKYMQPGKGFNEPASDHAFDYLKELDDAEFEKLVTLIFKQRGYTISENEDEKYEGVDVVLHMNNQATFVQYRHWREHHVDVVAIEELHAIMDAESAPNGIIITTGIFSDDALDAIHGKALMLINGVDLSLMVNALSASNEAGILESEIQEDENKQEMPELEPLCPICSQQMILRTAKKGKNAGNTFWGCSQYPNCRGVVSN